MLIFDYPSKKDLKAHVGQALKFRETSPICVEYTANGELFGCNRPHITGHKREFFAKVTMQGGLIKSVE